MYFDGIVEELEGKMVDVKIVDSGTYSLTGELVVVESACV